MTKKIQRALVSLSDKTGLEALGKGLGSLGVEILSTGGTALALAGCGVTVREVADLTQFPEMLDGRVKTLHPKVHGGILGRRGNPEHVRQAAEHGIEWIDLVVVNLYPFERTAAKPGVGWEELIENIDIGGPAMIRSAAKNHEDVAVVVSPEDYPSVLEEMKASQGSLSAETRLRLARKAFSHTAAYDAAISATLDRQADADRPDDIKDETSLSLPAKLLLSYEKAADLRYGENPHQKAALYRPGGKSEGRGVAFAQQLQGKELSFNNLVDLQAGWNLAEEFDQPTTVMIKHTNPCGAASAENLAESYRKALEADPVSAFGSVIAFNRPLDSETAEETAKLFVEAVIAPGYEAAANERLSKKKNLRLMIMDRLKEEAGSEVFELKNLGDGLLVQTQDRKLNNPDQWRTVTARQPSPEEQEALLFAWRVAKHVKSNAIVFVRESRTVGVGAGQMSRVDAAQIAIRKAKELKHSLAGTVVGSDAFFPFPDGVRVAGEAGATAVIQPGGSVRDEEVIEAANRLGLAMVFTGIRHFRH